MEELIQQQVNSPFLYWLNGQEAGGHQDVLCYVIVPVLIKVRVTTLEELLEGQPTGGGVGVDKEKEDASVEIERHECSNLLYLNFLTLSLISNPVDKESDEFTKEHIDDDDNLCQDEVEHSAPVQINHPLVAYSLFDLVPILVQSIIPVEHMIFGLVISFSLEVTLTVTGE